MSANDPKRTSPDQTSLTLRPNLLCLVSVVPSPSNGMVAWTGEISLKLLLAQQLRGR